MKISLICLVIAICARLAFEALIAQTVETPTDKSSPDVFYIEGGASGKWLEIRRANTKDYENRAFDPSYTVLFSDFEPVIKRLANGRWQIQFTSEIATGVP